jgi:CRP-like cAMP-binding protein
VLTTIERVLALQEVPLLRSLPTEALVHLATLSREERLTDGTTLWKVGDPADAVYFVVDGVLALGVDAETYTVTHSADIGASALLVAGATRDTDAVVVRQALLLRVGREDFFEVLGDHPDVARALLEALGGRLDPESRDLDVSAEAELSAAPLSTNPIPS